jgi:hypothetical protein
MLPASNLMAKEAKHMNINTINNVAIEEICENGELYYNNEAGNTIKLGTFKFDKKYGHVEIDLGMICLIKFEHFTSKTMIGSLPYMHWFKSQYVCDRYHGTGYEDVEWILNHFREVTPYSDKVNELLEMTIRKLVSKATSFDAKEVA